MKRLIPKKDFKFWIKSNRGTNKFAIKKIRIPEDYTEKEIESLLKYELEEWCSGFAAWTQSWIHYGYIDLQEEKDQIKKVNIFFEWKVYGERRE